MKSEKYYHMTSSTGIGNTELTSFDKALLESGIANYNLVRISSILPPRCIECTQVYLSEGSILHTAYARISTNIVGKVISTAVGVAIPDREEEVGVIMEFSGFCSAFEAKNNIQEMLVEAMMNRNSKIKEIKISANEAVAVKSNTFVTSFSALSIWDMGSDSNFI